MNILAPEIKVQWTIKAINKLILYTIIVFIFEYYFNFDLLNNLVIPKYNITLIIFIINLIMVIFLPKLKYKYWKFDVRQDSIYIERGVFTRVFTTAPFSRVQHIDVVQSVLDRWLGLGKLVIYTAGTKGADLLIPGLPIQYAEYLRDYLKNYTLEDSV